MLYKKRLWLPLVACAVLMLHAFVSLAETGDDDTDDEIPGLVTESGTQDAPPQGKWTETAREYPLPTPSRTINFTDFDLNRDSILSINEIGEMLFKLYDTDGNEIIDNKEYERRAVFTVIPMAKETVISYDFDGDGKADAEKYQYETFQRDTLLTQFDHNKDGLSPHEFTGKYFLSADVNKDAAVDLKEWQGTYIASLDRKNKEAARFNTK